MKIAKPPCEHVPKKFDESSPVGKPFQLRCSNHTFWPPLLARTFKIQDLTLRRPYTFWIHKSINADPEEKRMLSNCQLHPKERMPSQRHPTYRPSFSTVSSRSPKTWEIEMGTSNKANVRTGGQVKENLEIGYICQTLLLFAFLCQHLCFCCNFSLETASPMWIAKSRTLHTHNHHNGFAWCFLRKQFLVVQWIPNHQVGILLAHRLNSATSTLPKTNIAPENGWLEFGRWNLFLLGRPIFRGELLVSGRVWTKKPYRECCL